MPQLSPLEVPLTKLEHETYTTTPTTPGYRTLNPEKHQSQPKPHPLEPAPHQPSTNTDKSCLNLATPELPCNLSLTHPRPQSPSTQQKSLARKKPNWCLSGTGRVDPSSSPQTLLCSSPYVTYSLLALPYPKGPNYLHRRISGFYRRNHSYGWGKCPPCKHSGKNHEEAGSTARHSAARSCSRSPS